MIHFQCDFGACLFGVYFDDLQRAFCICFGPLLVAFQYGDPDYEDGYAT